MFSRNLHKSSSFIIFMFVLMLFVVAGVGIYRTVAEADDTYYNLVSSSHSFPKIVHQTWKVKDGKDDFHRLLIDRHRRMNPRWKFVLYDDDDIQYFLEQHFPHRVVQAYRKINPRYGACRADFFRYCVLYKYGGIYLDIKSSIRKKLDHIKFPETNGDRTKDVLMVGHWKSAVWKEILEDPKGEIMNWVILSTPAHPLLWLVIEQMVSNIEDFNVKIVNYNWKLGDKYAATRAKYMVLEMTGPLMFSRVLWRYDKSPSLVVSDQEIHEYFDYSGFGDHIHAYERVNAQHYSKIKDALVL